MTRQEQFLDVIDRDEAQRRFLAALELHPLGAEEIVLDEALGRVLAQDIVATVDVPSFDRSGYDGFALQAADTYGAREETPRRLTLLEEAIVPGVTPIHEVTPGTAIAIATGAMVPRGADAIMMVEHTELENDDSKAGDLIVRRPVTPGFGVAHAGLDVAAGETVLRRGDPLTSRETGVLAAIGAARASVWRRPRVAIISTGDELIPPGQSMRPGLVYDSNARILADAVRELGAAPLGLGISSDHLESLRAALQRALATADVVLLSGGTSKGEGDLCCQVVGELDDPGIVAHGVALKPGKPICLAASGGKPVVVLPGFPTSAIFTFHEFVAPVIRALGGRAAGMRQTLRAKMAVKVNSEVGRTEYLLVGLVQRAVAGESELLVALPMGKGSGSVTTFSRADGFVTIRRHQEIIEAGTEVVVERLAADLEPADLVVIGSHCVGLDYLLGQMQDRGFRTKFLAVGSTAGLAAVERDECDLAGIHLLDPATGQYNRPLLSGQIDLVPGYGRKQGVLFRPGDRRFAGPTAAGAVLAVKDDPACVMVNRNQGSGTRILIDQLLEGSQPRGYAVQARSHSAVAASVAQSRADWGLAIESVARSQGLGFLPLQDEQYDFATSHSRRARPAVAAFVELLAEPEVREHLRSLGFTF
jgi:putative molybdopterin biosynthesis protein